MGSKDFMEAWTGSVQNARGSYVQVCTLRMGKAQYPFNAAHFKALKAICDHAKEDKVYEGDIYYGKQGAWRAILQVRHITPTRVVYILDPQGNQRKVEDQSRINVLLAMIEFEGENSEVVSNHIEEMYHGRDVCPGETAEASVEDEGL